MDNPLTSQASLDEFIRRFSKKLVIDPIALLTYEIDAANDRGRPDGVVFPESIEDVIDAVRLTGAMGMPLVARGAGTGLSGGAVAEQGGVIVEFSRLNHVVELDTQGRMVRVEPGMVNLKLDEFVKKAGLYFPPDPASGRTATLGGNLAENAGGPHCFKYGVMTNYVNGLEVVLADGRLIRFGGPAYDYPEYDYCSVFVGSEGTLGIIVNAWLRLMRNPPGVTTMMAAFNTVEEAGQAVSSIIESGLVPATMEFMDQRMMRIIEDYAHAGLPVDAGAALIIEVDGHPESLASQMDEIVVLLGKHSAFNLRIAQSKEERERIWYGRKSAAGAMARLSPAYYLLDGTVPRSRLAEALTAVNRICADLELRVAYVFHAGDGNLHPFILIEEPHNPAYMHRIHQAGELVMRVCVERNGSITGEHGVGIEKRRFMPLMYNRDELSAMLDLKTVFDPQNLLNPGKIYPVDDRPPFSASNLVEKVPGTSDLMPANVAEAAQMMLALAANGKAYRILGNRTKAGNIPSADLQLGTRHMSQVKDFKPADLYITVEAGATLSEVQKVLCAAGMRLSVASPWPEATIGGMLATNTNAPLRMRYGGLKDQVLAVKAVLPDGRLIQIGRPVVKNVAGYDLPRLFVGSHGTLGLIGEVTFKLTAIPRDRCSLVIPLDDLAVGLRAGQSLLPVCLAASALLLITGKLQYPDEWQASLTSSPYSLVYTIEGHPGDVKAEMQQVQERLRDLGLPKGTCLADMDGNLLWGNWLAEQHQGAEQLLKVGVPPGRLGQLAEAVAGIDRVLIDFASGFLWWAAPHGMDGSRGELLASTATRLDGYTQILASPGQIPGKLHFLARQPDSLDAMQHLKLLWDPGKLCNPQSIWDL